MRLNLKEKYEIAKWSNFILLILLILLNSSISQDKQNELVEKQNTALETCMKHKDVYENLILVTSEEISANYFCESHFNTREVVDKLNNVLKNYELEEEFKVVESEKTLFQKGAEKIMLNYTQETE
ncbi:MAG: hypothetical protein ACOCRX_05800 [Candidatus Woesearchaeota archaeon]